MAIYRNCVCVEREKLASSLKCRRALRKHPFINTAGVVLITVTAVTDSKPQHCWCCSGTQVSASKTQLAAFVSIQESKNLRSLINTQKTVLSISQNAAVGKAQ